jgi:hypothetical protein
VAKRKPNTRIIILDSQEKIVAEMIKVGNRLAHYDAERWAPCSSEEVLEWEELVKAYNALKKNK